jgi:hypothetical protein
MRQIAAAVAVFAGCVGLATLMGCGDDSGSSPTSTATPTATATPTLGPSAVVVFSGENNRLNAYDPADNFRKQTVVPSNADAPGGVGRDLNGQICFRRDTQGLHFIGGEDTNQGSMHATAGWGYFTLTGTRVGDFKYQEIGKLIPTYQQTPDEAENYGCGFLSDGRLVTTDVGDQASGASNGQLIMWFPPFNTGADYTDGGVLPTTPAHYCKLDIAIGTAGGIYVDPTDRIYVGSARNEPGIYRYTGPFPTSDTADGGCGQVDGTGAPLATEIHKELFIAPDSNVTTISNIVPSTHGTFYVSSVFNGIIGEYGADGKFIRRVLARATGDNTPPYMTGTPLGLGIDSSGTLYYADIGIVVRGTNIGPGSHTGTVRRIRFVDGQPQPPETMDTGLNFPDGIGVLEQ